jgi:hypothetical protein
MSARQLHYIHRIRSELQEDRARQRRWTNRVIWESARLLDALEDWQDTPDEPHRTEARRWAQRCARDLKKSRERLTGIKAAVFATEEHLRAALKVAQGMEIA